jgi:hypothetical protein
MASAVPVGASAATPSFSSFPASGATFTARQQMQGAQSNADSSLLTASFDTPGSGAATPSNPVSALLGQPSDADAASSWAANIAALSAAYFATKSLSPVALAYLQNLPSNTTTTFS